jgi:hypothetical protein
MKPADNTVMNKSFVCTVFFLLLNTLVFAQDAPELTEAGTEALPVAFRGLSLGMTLDDLKARLLDDKMFRFRGDRDVSFLPLTDQKLVESAGTDYIKRAFFQIKDGAVFIMAFTMNTDMIDHYSIYTAFTAKYGEPKLLSPKEAVWESETTRVSIERPLTVKYIDLKTFDALVNDSHVASSRAAELREEFLNDF